MITFYAHEFAVGADRPNPGNTEYPWGEDDTSFGSGGKDCMPTALGPAGGETVTIEGQSVTTNDCESSTTNVLYVYSTAGPVQTEMVNEGIAGANPYASFHNERGQTKDILLDTTKEITARFFMSADDHSWNRFDTSVTPGVPNA